MSNHTPFNYEPGYVFKPVDMEMYPSLPNAMINPCREIFMDILPREIEEKLDALEAFDE